MHYLVYMNRTYSIVLLLAFFFIYEGFGQNTKFNPSEYDMKFFSRKVEERVYDLEEKIKVISNKELETERKLDAINAAMKYFESEDNVFQVSSKKRSEIRNYSLREYFNHIRVLPYLKVNIEWYDAVWVTDLRKDRNGIWRGTVRIFQKFEGFGPDGTLKYTDITKKDIPVSIEVLEVNTGTNIKKVIRVLLGDIRVTETV